MKSEKPTKRKRAAKKSDASLLERAARGALEATNYNAVVEHAHLDQIRLMGMNFLLHPAFFDTPDGAPPAVAYKLSLGGEMSTSSHDPERGQTIALFTWWVEARASEPEPRMRFQCTYLVAYTNLKGHAQSAAAAFVHRVGQFAVYPYVRGLFAHTTAEAGVELPPLPVLREGNTVPIRQVPPPAESASG